MIQMKHLEDIEAVRAVIDAAGTDMNALSQTAREFLHMQTQVADRLRDAVDAGEPVTANLNVTPGGALYLLSINDENRGVAQGKVGEYRADIAKGNWQLNGVGLVIADTCQLNDGQHRLIAVYMQGVTVRMQMTFGVARSTRSTVDIGRTRTPAVILAMDGITFSNERLAITRLLEGLEKGEMKRIASLIGVPASAYMDRARDDEALGEAASWAGNSKKAFKARNLEPSLVGVLHYLLMPIDPLRAFSFLDGIKRMRGIGDTDPRGTLVDSLQRNEGKDLPIAKRLEMCLVAWNAYHADQPLRRITTSGAMPVIAGYDYDRPAWNARGARKAA